MLRGNIVGIALTALLGMSAAGDSDERASGCLPRVAASPPLVQQPGPAVAQAATCANDCQAQHDRCRVHTKGSATCDAERQRCLEICLQKKKR